MKSIIEPIIEEYELGQKNNELKDPLIFLFKNLASNETHKRIFCFKVTSIDENRYSNYRIARCLYKRESSYSPDTTSAGNSTEIKKTVTLIDLVVNKQIYIFLCTLIYVVIYTITKYLM